MKKIMTLLIIVFITSGFSWGRSKDTAAEEKKVETPKSSYSSSVRAAEPVTQTVATTASKSLETASKSEPVKKATSAWASSTELSSQTAVTPAATSAKATARPVIPNTLTSALASGDEEQRKAKVESLKRLSRALQEMSKKRQAAVQ